MTQDKPRMTIEEVGGVKIVTLADQRILDELSIAKIGKQLNDLVAQNPQIKMVLDFVNVTNMSSSALGMLITLHKRVRESNGHLRLCNIQPTIQEVFKITRLDEIFHICASKGEALDSVE